MSSLALAYHVCAAAVGKAAAAAPADADVKAAVIELAASAGKASELPSAWADFAFPSPAGAHTGPAVDALLSPASAPMLRAMLNIGVRHNAVQLRAYAAAEADAALAAAVATIEGAVEAAGAGGCSLLPSAAAAAAPAAPALADLVVAAALYEPLSLLFPPSVVGVARPAYARWFSAATSSPAFAAALAAAGARATGGSTRVGGQVDLRAGPARVAASADAAIERNAVFKKAAGQRDAENAHKNEKEAPAEAGAGAGGAGSSASSSSSSSSASASSAGGAAATAASPGAAPSHHAGGGSSSFPAPDSAQPEGNKSLPSLSVDARVSMTESRLSELGVPFSTVRHAAAPDVPSLLAALEGLLPGTRCKNLVIKAKKERRAGDSMLWLVVASTDTKVDLADLAKRLGYGKIMLRFATPDAMLDNLGVGPGSATPFALANDRMRLVNVAVDASLLSGGASAADPASGQQVVFHPLTNEASTAVSAGGLLRFIESTFHAVEVVDFSGAVA